MKYDKKRFEELEKFAQAVKHLVRETGRTYSVSTSDLEQLFIKYNIKLK